VCGTLNLLAELAPEAGAYRDLIVSLIGQAGSLAATMLMLDQGDFGGAARYLAIAARAARQAGMTSRMHAGALHRRRAARPADAGRTVERDRRGDHDPYDGYGLDDLFDAVVISGQVGYRKPDPVIYLLTASKIGVPAAGACSSTTRQPTCRLHRS
jgi:hypothetical protein